MKNGSKRKKLTKVDQIELGQIEVLGGEHVTFPVGVVSRSNHSARARPSTSGFDRSRRGHRSSVAGSGSSRSDGSGGGTSGGGLGVGNPSSSDRLSRLFVAVFRLVDDLSLREDDVLRVDDHVRRERASGEEFGIRRRSNLNRSFGESGLDGLLRVERSGGEEGGGSGLDGGGSLVDQVASLAGGLHSFGGIFDRLASESETLDRFGRSYLRSGSLEEGLEGGDRTTGGESVGGGKEGIDESEGDEGVGGEVHG